MVVNKEKWKIHDDRILPMELEKLGLVNFALGEVKDWAEENE